MGVIRDHEWNTEVTATVSITNNFRGVIKSVFKKIILKHP